MFLLFVPCFDYIHFCTVPGLPSLACVALLVCFWWKYLLSSPLRISLSNCNSYCMYLLFPFEKQKLRDFASPNYFSFDIKLHAWILMLHFLLWELKPLFIQLSAGSNGSFPSRAHRCVWSLTLKEAVSTYSLMLLEKLPANMEVSEGYRGSCNDFSSRMKWKKYRIHVTESTK